MEEQISIDLGAMNKLAPAIGDHTFFARSIESEPFENHLAAIRIPVPDITAKDPRTLVASSPVGELSTELYLTQWYSPDHPTVIYHHGEYERPFDFSPEAPNSFNKILHRDGKRLTDSGVNLIGLRAVYHDKSLLEYMHFVGELNNLVAELCVSVCLVEAVIGELRKICSGQLAVCGSSMGGWVTNLHRTFYNTADVYLPLLAGTALGEVFVNSAYSQLVGRLALDHPAVILDRLNFESEYREVSTPNVFPLLARYDQFVSYQRQLASYGDVPVASVDLGHVGALNAHQVLREHIVAHLPG